MNYNFDWIVVFSNLNIFAFIFKTIYACLAVHDACVWSLVCLKSGRLWSNRKGQLRDVQNTGSVQQSRDNPLAKKKARCVLVINLDMEGTYFVLLDSFSSQSWNKTFRNPWNAVSEMNGPVAHEWRKHFGPSCRRKAVSSSVVTESFKNLQVRVENLN